jgi:hypothetical protein
MKFLLTFAIALALAPVLFVVLQTSHFFSPTLRSGSFCTTLPTDQSLDRRANTTTTTIDHKITLIALTPDEQREIINRVNPHTEKALCLYLAEKCGETAFTMDGFDTYFITSPLNIR